MSDKCCTGEEKLEDLKNALLDVSQLRTTMSNNLCILWLTSWIVRVDVKEDMGHKFQETLDFEPWEVSCGFSVLLHDV